MEYGKPQKLPDGRYFCKINGAQRQVNGLVLQDDLSTKSVNFKVPEGSEIFSSIDGELLTQAKASKVEWFGKELSDETIQTAFQESVTDGVLGASLATVKGQVVTVAFDTQRNSVELQDVKAGTTVDALLELSGLWFLKKSFGPVWRVLQVRVRGVARPVVKTEYAFTDEPEEEGQADHDWLEAQACPQERDIDRQDIAKPAGGGSVVARAVPAMALLVKAGEEHRRHGHRDGIVGEHGKCHGHGERYEEVFDDAGEEHDGEVYDQDADCRHQNRER